MSKLNKIHRVVQQTSESGLNVFFYNRNPRNLERLRLGYKPRGYDLDLPGRTFWHKLELTVTGRHLCAQVIHHENGPVLEANTSEWAIKKHLYKCTDTSAYINLGKILADRCLKSGIVEMNCFLEIKENTKIEKFMKSLKEGGVCLHETSILPTPRPWNKIRIEKPWEVQEEP